MSTQPEALRLAEFCDGNVLYQPAAAELRRLHELALEQQGKIYALEMARSMEQKTAKLKQDALLEALKMAVRQNEHDMVMTGEECRQCRAAIKMVEEGK